MLPLAPLGLLIRRRDDEETERYFDGASAAKQEAVARGRGDGYGRDVEGWVLSPSKVAQRFASRVGSVSLIMICIACQSNLLQAIKSKEEWDG